MSINVVYRFPIKITDNDFITTENLVAKTARYGETCDNCSLSEYPNKFDEEKMICDETDLKINYPMNVTNTETQEKQLKPHHGGIYEAAVKSVKHHLSRIIGKTTLTFEEYATLLRQVDAYCVDYKNKLVIPHTDY